MAALETYWHGSKIYICLTFEIHTCTAYITHTRSSEYDLWLSTCVGLLLLRASVTHLSHILLLWSFKAKREYNGVQRQCDFDTRANTRLRCFHRDLHLFALTLAMTAGMRQSTHFDSGPQGREVEGKVLLRKLEIIFSLFSPKSATVLLWMWPKLVLE